MSESMSRSSSLPLLAPGGDVRTPPRGRNWNWNRRKLEPDTDTEILTKIMRERAETGTWVQVTSRSEHQCHRIHSSPHNTPRILADLLRFI